LAQCVDLVRSLFFWAFTSASLIKSDAAIHRNRILAEFLEAKWTLYIVETHALGVLSAGFVKYCSVTVENSVYKVSRAGYFRVPD